MFLGALVDAEPDVVPEADWAVVLGEESGRWVAVPGQVLSQTYLRVAEVDDAKDELAALVALARIRVMNLLGGACMRACQANRTGISHVRAYDYRHK